MFRELFKRVSVSLTDNDLYTFALLLIDIFESSEASSGIVLASAGKDAVGKLEGLT